jgi:hypothetical protein
MRGSACEATATGVTAIVDSRMRLQWTTTSRLGWRVRPGRFLIGCGDDNRMLMTGRGFDVRIKAGGGETNNRADTGACMLTALILVCGKCRAGRVVQVIHSTILYLREDDPTRSLWQSTSEALTVIQTVMNVGSTIPFLEGSSDLEYSFSGLRTV